MNTYLRLKATVANPPHPSAAPYSSKNLRLLIASTVVMACSTERPDFGHPSFDAGSSNATTAAEAGNNDLDASDESKPTASETDAEPPTGDAEDASSESRSDGTWSSVEDSLNSSSESSSNDTSGGSSDVSPTSSKSSTRETLDAGTDEHVDSGEEDGDSGQSPEETTSVEQSSQDVETSQVVTSAATTSDTLESSQAATSIGASADGGANFIDASLTDAAPDPEPEPDNVCGNGEVETGEVCDDDNVGNGDGCSAACTVEPGWSCPTPDPGDASDCEPICGDGLIRGPEGEDDRCDDGDLDVNDGCDDECNIEEGWSCGSEPSDCSTIDECDEGTANCHIDADCTDPGVGFECACRSGFFGDGVTCAPIAVSIAAGGGHTCGLFVGGKVRCWGHNGDGQLGYGHDEDIGDDERASSETSPEVDVGGTVTQVSLGTLHTCVVLSTGGLRCWGDGNLGVSGNGSVNDIGDGELPTSVPEVDVGGTVTQVAAGSSNTCALLSTGDVRCWGWASNSRLPYPNSSEDYGDNEAPSEAPIADIGGTVTQLAAGYAHMCALLSGGNVRCWGWGLNGVLGHESTASIGDNETPAQAGDIDIGGTATQLVAGNDHNCVLLTTGAVRCWGYGNDGQLGYASQDSIGDNETPAEAGDVNVGGTVAKLSAGGDNTCALLTNGEVRCWGWLGGLAQPSDDAFNVGDDEDPSDVPTIDIGGTATDIATGRFHTCAVLDTGAIRCWGNDLYGALGYGRSARDTPAESGNVFR